MTQKSRDIQIGGDHYRQYAIQPWDIWEEYGLNPWEADIIKRVLRDKGDRIEDLEKIIHVAKKLIELEETAQHEEHKPILHTLWGRIRHGLFSTQ